MIDLRHLSSWLLAAALSACVAPLKPSEMTFKQYKKSLGRDVNNTYASMGDLQDFTNWQAAGGYKEEAPTKRKGNGEANLAEALNLAVAGLQLANAVKGTQQSLPQRSTFTGQQSDATTRRQMLEIVQGNLNPRQSSAPVKSGGQIDPWGSSAIQVTNANQTSQPLTQSSFPIRIVETYDMGGGDQGISVANVSNATVSVTIWKQGYLPKDGGRYDLSPGEKITADATFKWLKRGQGFLFMQK